VFQRFNGTDPLFGLLLPHLPEQVDALRPQGLLQGCLQVGLCLPLGEGLLELGELLDARPHAVVGSALAPEDLEDLVDLAVALEERLPVSHLDHDAACAPDVYAQVLTLLAQQNLGAALPECDHLVRECLQRELLAACQSEVAQFHVLRGVVDQHVLRFEVSVHDPPFVAVDERQQDLLSDLLDERQLQGRMCLYLLLEVGVFEIEDHVEFGAAEVVLVDLEDVGEVQVL